MLPEPHSEKQIEDCIGWGLDAGREVLECTMDAPAGYETREQAEALLSRVHCPVLVIHGDDDRITPLACGQRVAALTGGELVVLEGSGHTPQARDPVKVNVLIDAFAERVLGAPPQPERRWRARSRAASARCSSPPRSASATPGATWRSRASCGALVPGLEIDWLALHPLTAALEAAGERVHPASRRLATSRRTSRRCPPRTRSRSSRRIREMDEILIANYMVFRDVVREQPYDLWIGDEAWDVDHFLHENPEDKCAPFVFLTDFVGWLPLPEGGEREAFLCADLNALMIEQVERFPLRARPRAVRRRARGRRAARFGPGLPEIRDWVQRHFEFTGQIHGRARAARAQRRRAAVRRGRRWLGRRRRAAGAAGRRLRRRGRARARAADARGRRAAGRPGGSSSRQTASRSAPTSPTSTACSPRATSRSSRAA